ncbi:MAG: M48 family metallopeptidase [Thermodesulfobacteriota bacterium]|nr:M48 family metallopeptidase [Thermodesulfobacteriota bacterium]
MNPYLIFILAVILIGYILDLTISIVNLSSLDPRLPDEFIDVLDGERYAQSQNYTRTTTTFSMIKETATTTLTIAFILIGGFNWVDMLARGFGLNTISTGLIFTAILLVIVACLEMPFSIYATFVIEERFGFNQTTRGTFILDLAKGIVLTVVIGGPVLAFVLWFFEKGGSWAWLYCWMGVVAAMMVIQFLAPVLIMPLFNKFTPLEDGELKETVTNYAAREKFQIKGIYTMDGSKRSTKLNAFFTGFGRFRRIVFFDTLVEKLSTGEIVAVLAHEMGHSKLKHIFKMLAASILQMGILFFILSLFINNRGLFAAFQMEHVSIYASLIFFGFLYSPISMLLSVIFNIFSRRHEFQADRYALNSTGRPEMLISALKKLSITNLSNLTPHPLHVFLNYSHPPVLERIKALGKIEDPPFLRRNRSGI